MKKKYKYKIIIAIRDSASSDVLYQGTSQYPGGRSRFDNVLIKGDSLSLECDRVTLVDLEGIFENYQSGLYGQISKSILFYISTMGTIPNIEKISIAVERGGIVVKNKVINSDEFKGHPKLLSPLRTSFDAGSLKTIFDESDKSSAILKSISHLIRSKTKQDPFDRFDSLWKSFNGLYKTITQKSKDFDCHLELRKFIISNPSASKNIAHLTSKMTALDLRNQLRWRALILNDFDTIKKTKAFYEFVTRYTDARLMKVFEETLPYRKDFLKSENRLSDVEKHINTHLNAGVKNEQEVVAILCIKYMYFVRNKSAHGERMDRIIGLGNKEVKEINWLGDLLEILIIDLVNASRLY
ncbi:hypothetical protein [Pseudomonas sp. S36]|uniref:hypothetical protein n=1 Tax=Pseudomonas sp. S36 TaxID=2767447 RepID=UPI001912134C|nr:hypothetical protein [Pseudomonas sp. S36]MBK4989218.1 hypothetical protein [Pseudomonas sp. S36]